MSDHVPRKIGPDGKTHQHFVQYNSKADARKRARSHSRGRSPIHHTAHEVGQKIIIIQLIKIEKNMQMEVIMNMESQNKPMKRKRIKRRTNFKNDKLHFFFINIFKIFYLTKIIL
jgi:hypothetical protein